MMQMPGYIVALHPDLLHFSLYYYEQWPSTFKHVTHGLEVRSHIVSSDISSMTQGWLMRPSGWSLAAKSWPMS